MRWILSLCFVGFTAFGVEFDRYYSVQEINSLLRKIATEHSDIAELAHLGLSPQGREIKLLTLGRFRRARNVYINGAHHGDERISSAAVLGIAAFLIENKNQDLVSRLLDSNLFLLQPLVNPDGYEKGSRENSYGIDLNRSYQQYSLESREVSFVRHLMRESEVKLAIALHSGSEGVLWPWGKDPERPEAYQDLLNLGRRAAYAMGLDSYRQSFFDYKTEGEFIDYAYAEHGALAFTFEISRHRAPKNISKFVERTLKGVLAIVDTGNTLDREKVVVSKIGATYAH